MKCLLVYAHPDDELIWGHPFLCNPDLQKSVLICTSDKNNPHRQEYRRGEEALAAVCESAGVDDVRMLSGFHSESYRLRTRGKGHGPLLMEWWEAIQSAVSDCDFIATHNPWGCYGHLDHLFVRRAVMEMETRPPVVWTDARVETTTWPLGTTRPHGHRLWEWTTKPEEFEPLKNEYESRQCYTWSREVPLTVTVYGEVPYEALVS